ncbi:hypothetical protein Tco_1438068 [Tanacetum coccineum]
MWTRRLRCNRRRMCVLLIRGAGDKVTDGGKDGESVGCCGEEGACGVEEGIGKLEDVCFIGSEFGGVLVVTMFEAIDERNREKMGSELVRVEATDF